MTRADRGTGRPRRRRRVHGGPRRGRRARSRSRCPGRTRCRAGSRTGPARSTRRGSRRRRRSSRSSRRSSAACVDAGATIIQIDEPSPAIHPDAPADFAALFNAAIEPVRRPRPAGRPSLLRQLPRPAAGRALVPADPRRRCSASTSTSSSSSSPTGRWPRSSSSREIADAGRDVAAGVIDVKNSHVETADEVAEPDRRDPRDRRPARAPDARPRLRLQPDGPLG